MKSITSQGEFSRSHFNNRSKSVIPRPADPVDMNRTGTISAIWVSAHNQEFLIRLQITVDNTNSLIFVRNIEELKLIHSSESERSFASY